MDLAGTFARGRSPVKRHDVYLVGLDPVQGSEIARLRPCVIVSPDELNNRLRTIIIAPLTSTRRQWPCRVAVTFKGVAGEAALDQIRAIDKTRLARRLGTLKASEAALVTARLVEMFG